MITALLLALPVAARADDTSAAFLALWKQGAEETSAPPDWDAFALKNPKHDLSAAARLLGGIERLRQHDAKGALTVFTSVATDGGASASESRKLCAAGAKSLIARAQMVLLAAKLQAFYARHVEYPGSLDELIAGKFAVDADVTDPFGQRFTYAAMERRTFPGVARQTYTLACETIKAQHSDLAAALDTARRSPKGYTLSSTDPAANQAFLKKARADGTPGPSQRMGPGQEIGDVTLWYVTDGFVVVNSQGFPVVIVKE